MLSRFILLAASLSPIFLAADTDSAGGCGTPAITGTTLKEKLESATGIIGQLDGEKTQLSKDLNAEKEKVTKLDGDKAQLAQDLKESKERVTALTGEKGQLGKDLAAEKAKVEGLEKKDQSIDARAGERAAANGAPPVPTEAAQTEAKSKNGEALYGEYKNLKGREKTAFFREHEKALNAYAKEQAKAGN